MAEETFDAVIIGAGTKSMVTALYLQSYGGMKVGLITFGPGYGVANSVAEDYGVEKWWPEPGSVTKAREEGLL